MAYRVLISGAKPEDVGISHPSSSKVVMSRSALEQLHLSIPDELSSQVVVEGAPHAP